jgi:hypothetical protein
VLLGGAMYLAYQKSETFRGIVDTLFNGVLKPFGEFLGGVLLDGIRIVAQMLLSMGRFGIMAFRLLLTGAFATFDGILLAAEKGLGWIPGLGDKIKGARSAFNEFGDATIAKLERVEDRLRTTSAKLDELGKDRSATITVTTIHHTKTTSGDDFVGGMVRGRATGGPVTAGRPYVVGERRPELFVPRVSGTVLPRVPDSPSDLYDLDPDAFDDTPMRRREPVHVTLEVDGKVLAEVVTDEISDEQARR